MVDEKLREIEREYGVKVLYACEAGSRAYGLANEASDYDVRFIYVHPLDWYLSIDEKRDVIEMPISDQLDMSGWELRKALHLLRKSNPSILEWLHSDVVYDEDEDFMNALRNITQKAFNPIAVLHHYHKMAKRNLKEMGQGNEVAVKKYLNVVRPVLMCSMIMKCGHFPGTNIQYVVNALILNKHLKEELSSLLETKTCRPSQTKIDRLSLVDAFIKEQMEEIEFYLRDAEGESVNIKEELSDLFRSTVKQGEESE
ncbi:nucleotidyltransferase domain-containing protein [Pontibacillus sp. ALD_SL1]|uniref:nucleotidyltransferase domain-containing protein n=1 Tax=Pontibacillus sp. ALD_SL1 TaxID=2777185 RepID=UPI001A95A22B|nr:nucleotidyltransferase domain-containing protein [Pontibacillus sp. ALD_SL1]QST00645.1 nucleotidyltransferase domain-containing protein [Pontibacillus sp. ALD_SL1]